MHGLWAITCYFNPAESHSRLANYRLFRQRLVVPLVTVEWSNTGHFELAAADAEILVQLQSPDLLWQKERLLNIALHAVPRECGTIAWVDGDVVFEQEDWPASTTRALERFAVVQLFRELWDLPRGANLDQVTQLPADVSRASLISCLAAGTAPDDVFHTCGGSVTARYSAGHAWAARREVLDEHGFYDARILGSGNKVMLSAAYGQMDGSIHAYGMNPRESEHYRAWAKPYCAAVRGRIGHLPGRAFHLWHGDLSGRRYANRYIQFRQFAFDPYADIGLDERGCWRWATSKPAMHDYVANYLRSRKDD